jgi:hypothetical protein
MLKQYPSAPRQGDYTRNPRDDPTGRDDFLKQHKDAKNRKAKKSLSLLSLVTITMVGAGNRRC